MVVTQLQGCVQNPAYRPPDLRIFYAHRCFQSLNCKNLVIIGFLWENLGQRADAIAFADSQLYTNITRYGHVIANVIQYMVIWSDDCNLEPSKIVPMITNP
tara:strand:+ start:182 stop:484 length:303 start_codon:yes stop_codon:yes gene_type:complete